MAARRNEPEVTDFSNRLASLMLHDLASPLGAVSNALELIKGSSAPDPEALEILDEAVADLIARHAFLRVATAGNKAGAAGDGLRKALAGYIEGREAEFEWQPALPLPTENAMQCLALMVGVLGRDLGRRDKMEITDGMDDDGWFVSVRSTGRRARISDDALSIVRGERLRAPESRDVFAELLVRLMHEERDTLTADVQEDGVNLTLRTGS